MNRAAMLARARSRGDRPWDIAVVGGGATGMGVALDAAARGYDVILLEQHDFGKGTSSRSTKLVHGGVRYLEQGNISLVMEALKERGIVRASAPHLVTDLPFIVPNYEWWEAPFYGVGLKIYDLLAGRYGFGRSQRLSRDETLRRIPTLRTEGLRGGIVYYDGQFDDARLLIGIARTAAELGACLINHAPVTALIRDGDGLVCGLTFTDAEDPTAGRVSIAAKVVVNAAGPFVDNLRRMVDPDAAPMIAPSQGIHLVFDGSFLAGETAIMVPHTADKRVMFAIPWHGHTLVGTTDTPIEAPVLEPVATEAEIEFILSTAAQYLERPPRREDILSIFAGVRPLVKAGDAKSTSSLSRDHTISIDQAGLLTITGGKWTTYRRMAEDCVDQAATLAELEERPSRTRDLRIHGYTEGLDRSDPLSVYGSEADELRALMQTDPRLVEPLSPALPVTGAQIVWGARHEMARTLEDVLARRTRALFLNARAAVEMAPRAAALLADELGRDPTWAAQQIQAFNATAAGYLPAPQV